MRFIGMIDLSVPLGPTREIRVLVVDDEPSILEVIGIYLEDRGYRLTFANDGLEGLRQFESESGKFDIIISDRVMPAMTGDEMAAAIKSQAPQVPIILITGQHRGVPFDISPFSAFLPKPFTRTQLLAAVDDVLPLS